MPTVICLFIFDTYIEACLLVDFDGAATSCLPVPEGKASASLVVTVEAILNAASHLLYYPRPLPRPPPLPPLLVAQCMQQLIYDVNMLLKMVVLKGLRAVTFDFWLGS